MATQMSKLEQGLGAKEQKTILLVEDEQGIRETLQFALELRGFKVVTAANGKEGMDQLEKTPTPGLILLDLMMPVMNGWEFVEQLEKSQVYAEIPVVLVTAYTDQAAKLKEKVKRILSKPADLQVLYEVAKKWCGGEPQ